MPSTPSLGRRILACTALAAIAIQPVSAHFQELIPSQDLVTSQADARLELALTFTHPMSRGPAMAMREPLRFGVLAPDGQQDLRAALKPVEVDGHTAYVAGYQVTTPGDHQFFVEPAPYWEPAEGKMIIHYTKVVVDAYAGDQTWDQDVGMPVEISPLTWPYGLWAGNLFSGIVRHQGAPVPFAEVEVEWRNEGSLQAPADAFVTQVVKADVNGVFHYAMPRAGWWGFAALIDGETPMANPDGEMVAVELGGLIWVHAREMR